MTGRLSTFAAALVVARRDFGAILFSRSFIFFLLGPLFPVIIGYVSDTGVPTTDVVFKTAPAQPIANP